MSGQADEFVFLTTRQARPDGLFDRIDRAVVRAWRAIWTGLVDGLTAYGMAECGILIDANFTDAGQTRTDPVERYAYGAVDDDRQGELDDIHALIRSLQTTPD